jgi:hypothetical protein
LLDRRAPRSRQELAEPPGLDQKRLATVSRLQRSVEARPRHGRHEPAGRLGPGGERPQAELGGGETPGPHHESLVAPEHHVLLLEVHDAAGGLRALPRHVEESNRPLVVEAAAGGLAAARQRSALGG